MMKTAHRRPHDQMNSDNLRKKFFGYSSIGFMQKSSILIGFLVITSLPNVFLRLSIGDKINFVCCFECKMHDYNENHKLPRKMRKSKNRNILPFVEHFLKGEL